MKDIKEIVSKNLISLRKQYGLTQNELAKKLDYSDNTISRWECGELCPSVETLQKISEIYNIPLTSLFEENATKEVRKSAKYERIHKLFITMLFVSLAWFVAAVIYTYGKAIFHKNLWMAFVYAVPVSFLIMMPFNEVWGNVVYKCLITSAFLWSVLATIYLQFLKYNIWLVFIIGIPAQVGIIAWILLRRNKEKERKRQNSLK